MAHSTSIRLYVAHSRPVCVAGISALVASSTDIVVVGEALEWDEALAEIRAVSPDVVLMEDTLAGSVATALRGLKEQHLKTAVVFIADSAAAASPYDAMAHEAAGYLTLRVEPPRILQAVRDASQGQTAISSDLQMRLAEEIRIGEQAGGATLSGRERRILQLIANDHATAEIGSLLGVSEATVKSDVGSILMKLHVKHRAAAVAEAQRTGILK